VLLVDVEVDVDVDDVVALFVGPVTVEVDVPLPPEPLSSPQATTNGSADRAMADEQSEKRFMWASKESTILAARRLRDRGTRP